MRNYFCGWYFKCQFDNQALAFIPAIHKSNSNSSCSVQIITDSGAWNVDFPYEAFNNKKDFHIYVDDNYFGKNGIKVSIKDENLDITGEVKFGDFCPIRYDIMGPFHYVPFMECRHKIVSMSHSVNGTFLINGIKYDFRNALGYIEGDSGYSFPKEYAWTQCHFDDGSLMLSVANIPFGAFHFTGVIGIILWHGKEYRLATYLGARVIKNALGHIVIKQGNYIFEAKLIKKSSYPLRAPINGSMKRTIHESAVCHASYCFKHKDEILFNFESYKASFEYEY